MPSYLIILITILVSLGIIALFYVIIAYRKIGIVAKKVDYLVEDITYKTELVTSVIDSLVKIGNYLDIIDSLAQQNFDTVLKFSAKNKDAIYKTKEQIKEIVKAK